MERIILHGGMNASYVFIEMMLHLGFKSRFLAVCDSIDDRSDPFGIDEVCLDIRSLTITAKQLIPVDAPRQTDMFFDVELFEKQEQPEKAMCDIRR